MEIVGAYFKKTTEQHHMAGPYMEPPRKKKRGRPCNSWRRNLEADVKSTGKNSRKQRRTESYGDNLLAAYAPGG